MHAATPKRPGAYHKHKTCTRVLVSALIHTNVGPPDRMTGNLVPTCAELTSVYGVDGRTPAPRVCMTSSVACCRDSSSIGALRLALRTASKSALDPDLLCLPRHLVIRCSTQLFTIALSGLLADS